MKMHFPFAHSFSQHKIYSKGNHANELFPRRNDNVHFIFHFYFLYIKLYVICLEFLFGHLYQFACFWLENAFSVGHSVVKIFQFRWGKFYNVTLKELWNLRWKFLITDSNTLFWMHWIILETVGLVFKLTSLE